MTQIQTFLIGLICLVGYFSLFESEDPRLGLYYHPLTHVSYIPAPILVCVIRDLQFLQVMCLHLFARVVYITVFNLP